MKQYTTSPVKHTRFPVTCFLQENSCRKYHSQFPPTSVQPYDRKHCCRSVHAEIYLPHRSPPANSTLSEIISYNHAQVVSRKTGDPASSSGPAFPETAIESLKHLYPEISGCRKLCPISEYHTAGTRAAIILYASEHLGMQSEVVRSPSVFYNGRGAFIPVVYFVADARILIHNTDMSRS